MAFRCEMHNGVGLMFFQQLPDQTTVANVTVNELMTPIASEALQIAHVPGVRQFVQVDDRCRLFLHRL